MKSVKSRIRWLPITIILPLSLSMLSACSGGSSGLNSADSGNSGKSGKAVDITFWNPDVATMQPLYKKLVDTFNNEHPDIRVKLVNYPEDGYFEKLNTAFAANQGPDMWVGYYANDEYSKGYIEPLDDYIQRDSWDMTQYFQPITDLRTKGADGKTYGLPRDVSMNVIVYNKDIFDKYNVPYPSPDWTFDDFADTVRKLKHPEDKIYGTDISNALMETPLPWNMGADLLSDDGSQAVGYADSDAMIDYMTQFQDLAKDDDFLSAQLASTVSGDSSAFTAGLVAMSAGALWDVANLKQAKFNWAVVPYPKGPDGKQYAWMDTVQWHMNAKSKHKQETWEFMKFMSSEESSKIVADDMAWGIPVKKVWEDTGLANDPVMGVFYNEKDKDSKLPVYHRSTKARSYLWSDEMTAELDKLINPLKENDFSDPAAVMHEIANGMQAKLDGKS